MTLFGYLKFSQSWLIFAGRRLGLRALEFLLKALGHARISLCASEFDALLKCFDRARYVALAEKGSSFAKDARVALAFFGRIHDDY
jgi:hypothetical protein